ncbi:MAG: phytanoyl-CoA dioxygenase family protein [Herpetosiphonaceae bacterium]|nr:phytanoyl-CoA dioxygenase family protein [Herpetosiphonaceae bacterium]
MELTEQQKRFFQTFGYLIMPGLVKDDIDWITREFEGVFSDRGVVHDPNKRTVIVPFIDQRERFCTLLDHPGIHGIAAGLLGDDFNYLGGDGNYYTGDTQWHSDGFHKVGTFLKIALYLDPVTRHTGALRVLPGSQQVYLKDQQWGGLNARNATELWGIEQRDVPAIALESQPGDVVAFNHNIMHASFGGSTRRRMFTLNLSTQATTPEEIADLESFIAGGARFWKEQVHSDIMRETASPERLRHLRQPMEHEGHLPALVAKARAEMAEPARG